MKQIKIFLIASFLLFLSSNAHALDLSRVKTWAASEILTAADLNGEFNNILNRSLTNNDISASAGIVGSKLDLSSPGIIGATTAYAATYTTLTINSTSIFKDKMSFTQTDNNEYIDSLADGYLDFEATTGLRFRINATEQLNLIDGVLAGTTDNDIDLGSTTKEFKDLWIDGTANIDSLVADTADINGGTIDGVTIGATVAPTVTNIDINGGTIDGATIGGASAGAGTFTSLNANGGGALTGTWTDHGSITTVDINGGTMDGVQIGGTTATGELIVNDASDDADGLGSQGTSGQYLQSAGTGANPTWVTPLGVLLSTTTFTSVVLSGDIAVTSGKKYLIFLKIATETQDETIFLRINNDTTADNYSWMNEKITHATSPVETLTGDNADSEIELGDVEGSTNDDGMVCTLFFDTNYVSWGGAINGAYIHGLCSGREAGAVPMTRQVSGQWHNGVSLDPITSIEFHTTQVSSGVITGTATMYELN